LEENDLTFLIDQDLLSTCGSIKLDFIESGYRSGFSITAANPVSSGSGCSSGSCSTGSCGG